MRVRAQLEAMQGRFDVGRELIAQATLVAEEAALRLPLIAGMPHHAGYIELLAGDAAAAERALRPACEELERLSDWGHFATLAPLLADALYAQERDEEALRLAELVERVALPEDADPAIAWRRVRAKVLARRGDFDEAERLGREATALAAQTDLLDDRANAAADLAEVLRLAGRPQESAAALQEAIRLYDMKRNIAAAAELRTVLAELPIKI